MHSMDVSLPGSSDEFVLKSGVMYLRTIFETILEPAHKVLAYINLLIVLKVIPEAVLN